MRWSWRSDNRIELLENGEAFFPRVFDAIREAEHEVLLETFILFDDKVGRELREVLIGATERGVRVDMTVDGWGSRDLSPSFIDPLTAAGVRFRVFDPRPRALSMRLHVFRRLHRKLIVIDRRLGFIGGINFSADHLADFGAAAKQDYALAVRGPIVEDMRRFVEGARGRERGRRRRRLPRPAADGPAGGAEALLVTRDNLRSRRTIERQYSIAIRAARQRIVIANAYFFPGYLLLRDIRNAARRGVDVELILQGEPDMLLPMLAARTLYNSLLTAGVRIFEYCDRPLHSKVAVVDDAWATVGSSNLDPLSLSLNLEANLCIRDRAFNRELTARLSELMTHDCREIDAAEARRPALMRPLIGVLAFHFLRRFPSWVALLPPHRPKLRSIARVAEPEEERR